MVEGDNIIVQIISDHLTFPMGLGNKYYFTITKMERIQEEVKKGDYILGKIKLDGNLNEFYLEAIAKSDKERWDKQEKAEING